MIVEPVSGIGVYLILGIIMLLFGLYILRFIIGIAVSILKKIAVVVVIFVVIWFGMNILGVPLPI